jgi:hypothetical protein
MCREAVVACFNVLSQHLCEFILLTVNGTSKNLDFKPEMQTLNCVQPLIGLCSSEGISVTSVR